MSMSSSNYVIWQCIGCLSLEATLRVVLQNPFADDGLDFAHSLTVGGEYEVLGICVDDFRLLDDQNEPVLYDAQCFKVTDAEEPSFWVSQLGAEGERYADPIEWSMPGYFEDWHDGVIDVVSTFWIDLDRLYPWTASQRRATRTH